MTRFLEAWSEKKNGLGVKGKKREAKVKKKICQVPLMSKEYLQTKAAKCDKKDRTNRPKHRRGKSGNQNFHKSKNCHRFIGFWLSGNLSARVRIIVRALSTQITPI